MITPTPPAEAARPTPESDEFFLLAYGEPLSANAKLDRKFSRTLERQRDEAREERDALRVALADLMKLRNTIEVMGEWSALDMNRSLYKRESEKVAAAMEQARKLIPNP